MLHLARFFTVLRRGPGRVAVAVAAIAVVAVTLGAMPASAQVDAGAAGTAGPADAPRPGPSIAALTDLIVTLESETGRTALIDQLKALRDARRGAADGAPGPAEGAEGSPPVAGAALLGAATERMRRVGEEIIASVRIVADAPQLVPWLHTQISDPAKRSAWTNALWKIAAAIAVAVAAELVANRLLARPRRALETRADDSWSVRALTLGARTVLDLMPVIAFALAAEAALALLEPKAVTLSAARAIVAANVLARGVMVVARMLLAPHVERLRVLPIDGETANYAYVWVRRFATVGLYGAFAIRAATILGLPAAGRAVLDNLLGLVLAGMAVALILQLREPVRDRIAGDPAQAVTGLRARLADIWHVAAIIYVIALFCIRLLDVEGGFVLIARASAVTLLSIVGARLAAMGSDRLLRSVFSLRAETRIRYPELQQRAGRYLSIVHGIVHVAIILVAILVVAEAWGLQAFAWLGSPTGQTVLGTVAQILIVAVLAIAALEIASSAIERYMRRAQDRGQSSARIQTLLPLLRNVLRVTIFILATLIVLSEIGINIGPLLAGAGVAGLAIGFGAQKLVQDVINGMFIIIEDTISIGDVVSVASHTGVCEGLTIRTITLRDLAGTVHTVPFSDVTTIQNLTKDFSYAVMDVGVAYREDTDEVVDILHEVDAKLREDPDYAAVILEPMEVLGVDALGDSAVVIKVRIKTQPIKQWTVRREFNRRMKKAFDAKGIEIPFPHTTLYFGEGKHGEAPPAHIVLAERTAARDQREADEAARRGSASARSDERPGTDLPE